MGKRGAPRKPTHLRIVEGNAGRRPLPKNEPKPAPPTHINPPKWLAKDAADVWKDLAPHFHAARLLTAIDVEMFSHACVSIAECRNCYLLVTKLETEMEAVDTEESTDLKATKAQKEKAAELKSLSRRIYRLHQRQATAYNRAEKILSKFGATPSDRATIILPEEPPDDAGYF